MHYLICHFLTIVYLLEIEGVESTVTPNENEPAYTLRIKKEKTRTWLSFVDQDETIMWHFRMLSSLVYQFIYLFISAFVDKEHIIFQSVFDNFLERKTFTLLILKEIISHFLTLLDIRDSNGKYQSNKKKNMFTFGIL